MFQTINHLSNRPTFLSQYFTRYPVPPSNRGSYSYEVLVVDSVTQIFQSTSNPDWYLWDNPITIAHLLGESFNQSWTILNKHPSYQTNHGVDFILFCALSAHKTGPLFNMEDDMPESVTLTELWYKSWMMFPRTILRFIKIPTASAYQVVSRDYHTRPMIASWIAAHSGNMDDLPHQVRIRQYEYLNKTNHPLIQYIVLDRLKVYKNYQTKKYKMSESLQAQIYDSYAESRIVLVPVGDLPLSKRFFDAMNIAAIPFVFSDEAHYPFETIFLHYEFIILQAPMFDTSKIQRGLNLLTNHKETMYRRNVEAQSMMHNIGADLTFQKGHYMWAWSWSAYILCCYRASCTRRH